MFSLQDLLGQQQGNEALQEISSNVGAEPSAVNSAIQAALPTILGRCSWGDRSASMVITRG